MDARPNTIFICNSFGIYSFYTVWVLVFIGALIDLKTLFNTFHSSLNQISFLLCLFIHPFSEFCNSHSPNLPCLTLFSKFFSFAQIVCSGWRLVCCSPLEHLPCFSNFIQTMIMPSVIPLSFPS